MHEELADTLAMLVPPYRLREQRAYVKNYQLPTSLHLFISDWEAVRDNNLLNALAVLHLEEAFVAEDAMRREAVNFRRTASLHDSLGCRDPGCGLVDHVVDEEDRSITNVSDKSYCCFYCWVLQLFFLFFGDRSLVKCATNRALFLKGRGIRDERGHHMLRSVTGL